MKLTYTDQIKHPNWQKRRLEMLEYYGWECAECGAKDKTLHVHHKQYFKGRMIWEYSDTDLIVLCDVCHANTHQVSDRIKQLLTLVNIHEAYALLAGYFGRDDDMDPGLIEEARQTDGLAFAMGFTASLANSDITEIEKLAEYVTRSNTRTRQILEDSRHVFGHKE